MWLLYHFIRFEFILKVTHFLFVQLIRTIKEFEPPAFGINSFINSEKSASIFPLSKQSLFEKFLHQNVRFMNYSLESNDTFMWNSYCGCMKWCTVQWTHVTHIYYWLDFETLSNNNSIVPRIFIRVFSSAIYRQSIHTKWNHLNPINKMISVAKFQFFNKNLLQNSRKILNFGL